MFEDESQSKEDSLVLSIPPSGSAQETSGRESHLPGDERSTDMLSSLKDRDEPQTHTLVPNELLEDYNNAVETMKSEIIAYQKEQEGLSSEISHLIEENKKLTAELNVAQKSRNKEESTILNLQERLRTTEEARNSAVQMWQNSIKELSNYEKLAQANHDDKEFKAMETKVSQMRDEYVHAVNVLQVELQEAKDELRKIREQYSVTVQQLKECKKLCDSLQEQLKSKKSDNDVLQRKCSVSQAQLLEKEAKLSEYQNKLSLQEKAELRLKAKIAELEQLNTELQKQNAELSVKESKITQEAKESVRLAEDAILQKEEALFREQQAIKEAERLQLSLNQLIETAAQRTKQEVDNIKKKCNENKMHLMEELRALEMDNNEKQALYDRVLREKQAAEAALESLYNEGLHKGPHNSPLYEDLIKRLTETEQTCNRATIRAQSLEVELQKTKASHQQEIDLHCTEKRVLQDRLHQAQDKLKEKCVQGVKHAEKLEQIQQLLKEKEDNGLLTSKRLKKEIQMLKERIRHQEEEYNLRLKNIDETYQASLAELQKLLDAQKEMSAKWKSEAHTLADKLEKEMGEMYKESSQMQQNNEELATELEKCRARIAFNEQQLSQYDKKISQLRQQLKKLQASSV